MAGTAKTTPQTTRALLLEAARLFGSASEYAKHDSNPGAQNAVEDSEKALIQAALAYAVGRVSDWLMDRSRKTRSSVHRKVYHRLAHEIVRYKWEGV
mgnify:CR=1 FL=1